MAQTRPRERQVIATAATQALPRLYTEADGIVRGQLDGLMLQFAASHLGFANEYDAARRIVDAGHGRSTAEPAEMPAVPAPDRSGTVAAPTTQAQAA